MFCQQTPTVSGGLILVNQCSENVERDLLAGEMDSLGMDYLLAGEWETAGISHYPIHHSDSLTRSPQPPDLECTSLMRYIPDECSFGTFPFDDSIPFIVSCPTVPMPRIKSEPKMSGPVKTESMNGSAPGDRIHYSSEVAADAAVGGQTECPAVPTRSFTWHDDHQPR